jgi:hypothetical protein
MSSNVPINPPQGAGITAPTPQNTPLTNQAPIAGLSRPTVPDITEEDEGAATAGDDPSDLQNAMLGLVQGRLAGLVGRSSGYIEKLPLETKRRIEALKGVQVKQTDLQNQYKHECFELEKKVRYREVYIYISLDDHFDDHVYMLCHNRMHGVRRSAISLLPMALLAYSLPIFLFF